MSSITISSGELLRRVSTKNPAADSSSESVDSTAAKDSSSSGDGSPRRGRGPRPAARVSPALFAEARPGARASTSGVFAGTLATSGAVALAGVKLGGGPTAFAPAAGSSTSISTIRPPQNDFSSRTTR